MGFRTSIFMAVLSAIFFSLPVFAQKSETGAEAPLPQIPPGGMVLPVQPAGTELQDSTSVIVVEKVLKAEEAQKAKEARQAEKARKAEEAKQAKEARKAEKAEKAKQAKEARKAEKARKAEEAKQAKQTKTEKQETDKQKEADKKPETDKQKQDSEQKQIQDEQKRQEADLKRQEADLRRQEAELKRQEADLRQQELEILKQQETDGKVAIAGLSTNLLFDAITAVNLGVEVPIGSRFGLHAGYTFPFWTFPGETVRFNVSALDLGARVYLHPWETRGYDLYRGWFFTVSAATGKFDLSWNGGGSQGTAIIGAVGGGYTWPVGTWWRLDVSGSAGAMICHFSDGRTSRLPDPAVFKVTMTYLFHYNKK